MKDEMIKNRFMELSQRARNKWTDTSTNFLDMNEIAIFERIKNHLPSNYFIFGGIDNAERKIIVFSMNEEIDESEFISYIKISPIDQKFGEELSHRNYLGAVMNLGIERDMVGDILVDKKIAYVIVIKNMAEYIADNIMSVNRTSVKTEIIYELPYNVSVRFKELTISSASERIDLMISKIYGLSRNESNEIFQKKGVYINGKLCTNNSYKLKFEDNVSVSGYGKFIFIDNVSVTKKGNYLFLIKKYY